MKWIDSELIDFIVDRSINNEYVCERDPLTPIENPLYQDGVRLKSILLREELDDLLGGDDLDDPTSMVSKVARVTLASSNVEPIPPNKYESSDIEEYRLYLEEKQEISERNLSIQNTYIENIPKMSYLNYRWRDKNILLFINNNYNPISIGLTEQDRLINSNLENSTRYYFKVPEETIRDELANVNFDQLRNRLISAGYEETVNEIDKELENYF